MRAATIKLPSPYLLGLVLLTALLTWLAWNTNAPRMGFVLANPSDPLGYYQWLPWTFFHGDWSAMPYVHYLPNGNGLSLFTMGVAILQAPFFLLAWLYCELTGTTATGFELPFVFARLLAAAFYGALGLSVTARTLLRYWGTNMVLISLGLLLFGTNLYYYIVHDGGMSHVYSFALFAWLLHLTLALSERPSGWNFFWIAICGALILLVRPLNAVVMILPLIYGPSLRSVLGERWALIRRYPWGPTVGAVVGLLILLPQLLYWKMQTGNYLVFTYGTKNEGFSWGSPHLFDVLFSHQGGWLVYHPLLIVAMVALLRGAWSQRSTDQDWRTILLIWSIVWYLYASWWNWWLGGSFGHRGFVEHLAFLVLPLTFAIDRLLTKSGPWRWGLLTLGSLLVFLNIRMSVLAYSPMDGPTWTWESLVTMWSDSFFL